MIRYVAIWQDDEKTVVIEYRPCYERELIKIGAVEILSVDIQYRPRSPFQERMEDRQKHGGLKKRGIILSEDEEHAEATQPTTYAEQLRLFDVKR